MQNVIMSSSQMVVNFKDVDYQLFNGIIVKWVSKGVHNLTITHSNTSRNSLLWDFYLLEHVISPVTIFNHTLQIS